MAKLDPIRERDSSYGTHLPKAWVAQSDRRELLRLLDEANSVADELAELLFRSSTLCLSTGAVRDSLREKYEQWKGQR